MYNYRYGYNNWYNNGYANPYNRRYDVNRVDPYYAVFDYFFPGHTFTVCRTHDYPKCNGGYNYYY